MKRSEAFDRLEPPKARFAHAVIDELSSVGGVESITFTGSFLSQTGIGGISDIDVVVVVRRLDSDTFIACRKAASRVSPALLGCSDHELIINDTFGPLKLDRPGVVVVHLMVYDFASHRQHVLKSPFTCWDWERSDYYAGRTLSEIYPVQRLAPSQFLGARRGITDYLEDLEQGELSCRRYRFVGDRCETEKFKHPLDVRHQGEFAYHIVRNLVHNYAKFIHGRNEVPDSQSLKEIWASQLPSCASFQRWFHRLSAIKQRRGSDFPADTVTRTREFLRAFHSDLQTVWRAPENRLTLIRHSRTALNDGTFLGQGRDPGIANQPSSLEHEYRRVVSSPSRRSRETAKALRPQADIEIDERLAEIDYGAAEGLDIEGLTRGYPEMVSAWKRGEDPAFPGGESTRQVAQRMEAFLSELNGGPTLIVTHNVVLRTLVGTLLGVPLSSWVKIPIEHVDPIEVVCHAGRFYVDLNETQRATLTDALVGFDSCV